MRTTTLSELRTLIRNRADVDFDSARHSDTRLNAEINLAIANLRNRLTVDGVELYLSTDSGTLSTTRASSGANYAELAVPATAEAIRGIDIVVDNQLYSLESSSLRERLAIDPSVTNTGVPEAWALLDLSTIGIFPVPDKAYAYTVWSQSQYTDLSLDADTVSILPGFVDYVVWCVVEKLAVRDDLESLKRDARMGMSESYATSLQSALGMRNPEHRRKDTRGFRQKRRLDPFTRWRMS